MFHSCGAGVEYNCLGKFSRQSFERPGINLFDRQHSRHAHNNYNCSSWRPRLWGLQCEDCNAADACLDILSRRSGQICWQSLKLHKQWWREASRAKANMFPAANWATSTNICRCLPKVTLPTPQRFQNCKPPDWKNTFSLSTAHGRSARGIARVFHE